MCPKDSAYSTDPCSAMFTDALVTTTTKWKQPKCPVMEEWITKVWYVHTKANCSAGKNKTKPEN